MAKNIRVNGVDYNSVTSIEVPLAAGGGNAAFPDTSDANAVEGDIATGKTAYVNGTKLTGTSSGGSPPSPPVEAEKKDVNFYDYDGFRVASYTLAEAAALSALPTAPDHSSDYVPLTFQEWNYTLAQVKALTQVCEVGATYIPTDGKTHLVIEILHLGRPTVSVYWTQTVSNGVTIDWGDGSAMQTSSATGSKNLSHTYAATGVYDITITVAVGCVMQPGHNTSGYNVMGSTTVGNRVFSTALIYAHLGNRVSIAQTYAFSNCQRLKKVTIPVGPTTIGGDTFFENRSLVCLIIPSSVTSMGGRACNNATSLETVSIPENFSYASASIFSACTRLSNVKISSRDAFGTQTFYQCYSLVGHIVIQGGVEVINGQVFNNCYAFSAVSIPNTVTSIGTKAFSACYGVMNCYIYPTTPPTLSYTDSFSGVPATCVMHVPADSLSLYQSATNWSAHKAKMVGDL